MSKRIAVVVVVSAVLVWCGAARSGGDKDARAIINKAIQATGGEENLKKHEAHTWNEKGTYYGMGEGLPYTGKYAVQWPNQMRMEIEGVFTMVVNGDKGWINAGGESKEMDKEQLANSITGHKAGWITTLLPLKDKAFTLSVLGEAQVEKKPALGVKVTRQAYPDVKLYFDKDSGRLLKSEFRSFSAEQKKEVTVENFYHDYKEMDGVQIPTHLIMKHDGKLFVDAHVTEVKGGVKFDAKTFAMP